MALRDGRRRPELRLLERLAAGERLPDTSDGAAILLDADLACRALDGALTISAAGRAHLARRKSTPGVDPVDPFRSQHLALSRRLADGPAGGRTTVSFDESESPLMWLARRKGRDGKALIGPHQFQAGERLRADFTLAQMMPRMTSNWEAPIGRGGGSDTGMQMSERLVAARQRFRKAMDMVGPELSGLLMDICCFLKKLEDVERERKWPARSAKVVLCVALDQLGRHYGYSGEARGPRHAGMRQWSASATDGG